MRIVITGAAGQIATQLIDELRGWHDLGLIDILPLSVRCSIAADLSKRATACRWNKLFRSADAIVHLAGNPDQNASWPEVSAANIETTRNVLESAVAYRVPRVVFASSNWVVKALEYRLAPQCYDPSGTKIGSDAAPCPVNPYGFSKAWGENKGRICVDAGELDSFVAVRIGAYCANPPDTDEMRRLWIGADDIRSLLRRCLEAEFSGFHVVYGVSAQASAPYHLSHTQTLLSWRPRQMPPDAPDDIRD